MMCGQGTKFQRDKIRGDFGEMNKKNKANEPNSLTEDSEGEMSDAHPTLSPDIQDNIGRQLRRHYGALVSEPLPDQLRELLERLAKAEPQGGAKS